MSDAEESSAPASSRLGAPAAQAIALTPCCTIKASRALPSSPLTAVRVTGTLSLVSSTGSLGLAMWQLGRNTALGAAEYMTPVLVQSQFNEKGVLTPAEFVAAGDMLVLRCPTWQWQAGDPAKARPFLPPDKQFLLTKNVPCQRRACTLGSGAADEAQVDGADGDEEGWVATHTAHAAKAIADEDAPDMEVVTAATASLGVSSAPTPPPPPPAATAAAAEPAAAALAAVPGLEDCEELEDEDDPSLLVAPVSGAGASTDGVDGILRTRTYDVSISYDKYYQCGRVWLYGYTEARQPLTQGQILEDISTDHALKTVSLEAHPHVAAGAGLYASIHPCKHASVMQKLTSELRAAGKEPKPEQVPPAHFPLTSECPLSDLRVTSECPLSDLRVTSDGPGWPAECGCFLVAC